MKKKLIEVALPLDAINVASAKEKSIRHGHPSTLHLWWARRPLAACRAVLFAQLVDDPSSLPEKFPTVEAQEKERERLFRIIEDLVKWENSNNEEVLERARAEIRRSCGGNPPPVLDPFCGGGSIPLEAQRLGLEAHGTDLNPVAVLITKALIELPPKFSNKPPVNPDSKGKIGGSSWQGAAGLAEDVRYYGQWMRDEAQKRIGHLYPKVKLEKNKHNVEEATVIAWLWARTVRCPNPACGCQMPLVRSFSLSSKKDRETWVEYEAGEGDRVRFTVKMGNGTPPEGTVSRKGAVCVLCRTPVPFDHIRAEGKAGRMSAQLMAMVVEGKHGREYLKPSEVQESASLVKIPIDVPDTNLPDQALGFRVQTYGMVKHRDLFTARQLVALTTLASLVNEARMQILSDGGSEEYSTAVATYLGFCVDKSALTNTTQATWQNNPDRLTQAFGRQALPMNWDYAEANPLSDAGGGFGITSHSVGKVLERLFPINLRGISSQRSALASMGLRSVVISTDPPYYDNIGYADLSDFLYVWLRRSLLSVYPDILSTLLVPKTEELVATPFRFNGSRDAADSFFEKGLGNAFENMCKAQIEDYPVTIFYAFKQSEDDSSEEAGVIEDLNDGLTSLTGVNNTFRSSTGWETMLAGLIHAGFSITGTWPLRTELITGLKKNVSALASSILLVCRPRLEAAATTTRKDFLATIKKELPEALRTLQLGNIAPVDFAQSAIGPGMAVFSRYHQVLEADGRPMGVRTALQVINQYLDEFLSEQEGEYDSDTRWAVTWFDTHGMAEKPYGEAETLSTAKNTSVQGLVDAGIITAKAGKVQLVSRNDLSEKWNPEQDRRLTAWEATQYLIRALDKEGEDSAARLLKRLGSLAEVCRDLAYRLYSICERKKWAQEALGYNSLVIAWPRLTSLASQKETSTEQTSLL